MGRCERCTAARTSVCQNAAVKRRDHAMLAAVGHDLVRDQGVVTVERPAAFVASSVK